MALVSAGWRMTVSLADTSFDITTRTYELRGATAADAATDALGILTVLDPVTDCQIVGYELTEKFEESVISLPGGNVKTTDQALVTVNIAGMGTKKASFNIPGPNVGIFQAAVGTGNDIVDLLDAALVAYSDVFKSTGEAFISDGEDLGSMYYGKRISRGSRTG